MEAQGLDIVLRVRPADDSGAPWQEIICITDDGSTLDKDVNVVQTRCGPKTGTTDPTYEITGNGVADGDPTVNQVSVLQMQQWAQDDTLLDFQRYNIAQGALAQGSVINWQGQAKVTSVGDVATVGEAVTYSFTLTPIGTPEIGQPIPA